MSKVVKLIDLVEAGLVEFKMGPEPQLVFRKIGPGNIFAAELTEEMRAEWWRRRQERIRRGNE